MIQNKKGQSTVEYVLLATAVVAAVVLFTIGKGEDSPFQKRLSNVLNQTSDGMGNMATRLMNSM